MSSRKAEKATPKIPRSAKAATVSGKPFPRCKQGCRVFWSRADMVTETSGWRSRDRTGLAAVGVLAETSAAKVERIACAAW